MRVGLCMSVATASRGVTVARMPAGRSVAPLANVADGECRDGPPQLVVRGKDAVVAMPCFRGGGTRSASRSMNSKGESSTMPLAPGRVDFRPRPGPTQLAALCRGIT